VRSIIVDIDGVMADSLSLLLQQFNQRTGSDYTPSEIKWYDFTDGTLDVSKEYGVLWADPDNALLPAMVFGCRSGISTIQYHGHMVVAATRRPPELMNATDRWLRNNFLFTSGLMHVDRAKDKLPGDLLVDDSPFEIELWERTGRPCILLRQPWNEFYFSGYKQMRIVQAPGRDIFVVNSWTAIPTVIEHISNGTPMRIDNDITPKDISKEIFSKRLVDQMMAYARDDI